jgi:hypothetical protein
MVTHIENKMRPWNNKRGMWHHVRKVDVPTDFMDQRATKSVTGNLKPENSMAKIFSGLTLIDIVCLKRKRNRFWTQHFYVDFCTHFMSNP